MDNNRIGTSVLILHPEGRYKVGRPKQHGAGLLSKNEQSNGGLVTFTHVSERFAVELSTCFNDLGLSLLGFEHPIFRMRGKRSNPLRHRRGWILVLPKDCT